MNPPLARIENGLTVFDMPTKLTSDNLVGIRTVVLDYIEKKRKPFALDLSKSDAASPIGVKILVHLHKTAEHHGASMELVNVAPPVLASFEGVGVSDVFNVRSA